MGRFAYGNYICHKGEARPVSWPTKSAQALHKRSAPLYRYLIDTNRQLFPSLRSDA